MSSFLIILSLNRLFYKQFFVNSQTICVRGADIAPCFFHIFINDIVQDHDLYICCENIVFVMLRFFVNFYYKLQMAGKLKVYWFVLRGSFEFFKLTKHIKEILN